MRIRLNNEICYMAGLVSKNGLQGSAVGITTSRSDIEKRFIDTAKKLGIEPSRLRLEEGRKSRRIFFYHSKLARLFREIRNREVKIFRSRNDFSSNYIAGIFDANGNVARMRINGMSNADELMLENLGIHTENKQIMNVKDFVALIKRFSCLLEQTRSPGNERDPR